MSFLDRVQRKINPENHSIGAKIRKIRLMKNISAKEVGKACGVNDMAVRNYELGQRQPNEQKLLDIADCLGVNIAALYERGIRSYTDVMHILFELESDYNVYPYELEKFPYFAIISKDDVLIECFKQWKKKHEEWENQTIQDEDYMNWKNSFPDNIQECAHGEELIKEVLYSEVEKRINTGRFFDDLERIKNDKIKLILNNINAGDISTAQSIIEEFSTTMDYLIQNGRKECI